MWDVRLAIAYQREIACQIAVEICGHFGLLPKRPTNRANIARASAYFRKRYHCHRSKKSSRTESTVGARSS
jgi:hypothetical protein